MARKLKRADFIRPTRRDCGEIAALTDAKAWTIYTQEYRVNKGASVKRHTLISYRLLAYLRGEILDFFADDANFEGVEIKPEILQGVKDEILQRIIDDSV